MIHIKGYGYIVNKQFRVNNNRSLSTILGLILSIILFTTVGYIYSYTKDINILEAKETSGNYEAILTNLDSEDIKILKNDVFTNIVGLYKEIYRGKINFAENEKSLSIYALDNIALENLFSPMIILEQGNFPRKNGEIIIDNLGREALKKDIGEKVSIDENEYEIVGFYKKSNSINSYNIEIITYFDESNYKENINVAFNTKNIKKKDIIIKNISDNLNIDIEDIKSGKSLTFNSMLFNSYNIETNFENTLIKKEKQVKFILYIVILILTTFLTYGSINVSIRERIQQFSILRCIGATKSKMRMLLIKESLFLLVFSLIPGILIAQLICYFISAIILNKLIGIYNYGLTYKVYFNVIVSVILLTTINITLATIIPLIKIGYVSPIEGIRNGQILQIDVKRKSSRIIKSLFGYDGELAYKNIRANNRRFIVTTMVSVMILVTFIVFTGYYSNLKESYNIQKNSSKDITLDILVRDKKINEDILYEVDKYKEEIRKLDISKDIFVRVDYPLTGVFKGVKLNRWIKEVSNDYEYGEKKVKIGNEEVVYSNNIILLLMDDVALKEILPLVEENKNLTLDDFKDNGVLITNRMVLKSYINPSIEKLFEINTNDKFTLLIKENLKDRTEILEDIDYVIKNNEEVSFKYLGSVDGKRIFDGGRYGISNRPTLIVSKEFYYNNKDLFAQNKDGKAILNPYSINLVLEFNKNINRNEALQIVENYSNKIEGHYVDSQEINREIGNSNAMLATITYTILFLIIIVSAVNIVNNKNINVRLRSKEIGTLLAIGINKRRLKKIIILEGIFQWAISILISLPLSFIILKIIYEVLFFSSDIKVSSMPIGAMIFGSIIFFIINVLGCYLPIRKLKYINTTELIRNAE